MLPDGKTIQGTSNKTTSFEVAKAISRSLSENSLVARVKYQDP
jgi:hypothetical protein